MKLSTQSALTAIALAVGLGAPGLAAAQEAESGESLVITSGTPTGSWFPTAAAIAELTNDQFSDNPVSAIVGAGSVGNIMHVGADRSELGLSYGAFLNLAQEGGNEVNPGEPMPDLRAVMSLIPYALHIFVAEGTDYDDFAQLSEEQPEINVGTGVTGATEHFGLNLVLEQFGAGLDKIEEWGGSVTQTQTAGRTDGWQNRQFDWASFMGTMPQTSYFQLLEDRPSKLVSIDDEARDTLVEDYGFAKYDIAAGTYPNQEEEWSTVGFPMVLFTTADVSEDVIYEMTKAVAENKERLVNATAAFEPWEPEDMVNALGVELHPGAARYYRERGWIE